MKTYNEYRNVMEELTIEAKEETTTEERHAEILVEYDRLDTLSYKALCIEKIKAGTMQPVKGEIISEEYLEQAKEQAIADLIEEIELIEADQEVILSEVIADGDIFTQVEVNYINSTINCHGEMSVEELSAHYDGVLNNWNDCVRMLHYTDVVRLNNKLKYLLGYEENILVWGELTNQQKKAISDQCPNERTYCLDYFQRYYKDCLTQEDYDKLILWGIITYTWGEK